MKEDIYKLILIDWQRADNKEINELLTQFANGEYKPVYEPENSDSEPSAVIERLKNDTNFVKTFLLLVVKESSQVSLAISYDLSFKSESADINVYTGPETDLNILSDIFIQGRNMVKNRLKEYSVELKYLFAKVTKKDDFIVALSNSLMMFRIPFYCKIPHRQKDKTTTMYITLVHTIDDNIEIEKTVLLKYFEDKFENCFQEDIPQLNYIIMSIQMCCPLSKTIPLRIFKNV